MDGKDVPLGCNILQDSGGMHSCFQPVNKHSAKFAVRFGGNK